MPSLVSVLIKRKSDMFIFFSDSPLNTDTRIIRALRHVPLVFVLTRFHCNSYAVSDCGYVLHLMGYLMATSEGTHHKKLKTESRLQLW